MGVDKINHRFAPGLPPGWRPREARDSHTCPASSPPLPRVGGLFFFFFFGVARAFTRTPPRFFPTPAPRGFFPSAGSLPTGLVGVPGRSLPAVSISRLRLLLFDSLPPPRSRITAGCGSVPDAAPQLAAACCPNDSLARIVRCAGGWRLGHVRSGEARVISAERKASAARRDVRQDGILLLPVETTTTADPSGTPPSSPVCVQQQRSAITKI